MSTFTIDDSALVAALKKMEALGTQMPQIMAKVRDEAQGHLILGARRSIYDTTPGAYRRTQDLLRGLQAQGRVAQNVATIEVSGNVPYQANVDLGQGPNEITGRQAQQYALANPDPNKPAYLGRTGDKYSLPALIIPGAQAFAAYRLKELFAQAVKDVR